MSNESNESDTEEIIVYAEFEDSVNVSTYRNIHVLGINEKRPIIQMDDTFFTGKFEHPLGTYMFFEEDSAPKSLDPLFDKLPEKNLKYVFKTRKYLNMEHAYIASKEGTVQDDKSQVEKEAEDEIQLPDFKSIEEALEKFKNEWIPVENKASNDDLNVKLNKDEGDKEVPSDMTDNK